MSSTETVQVLLALYEHHERQSRHHDDQNTKVVTLVLILASAALGLVGLNQDTTTVDVWSGVFLFLIGCYGAVFSTKHYERHFRKKLAAHAVRNALEESCSKEVPLRELRTGAEAKLLKHFPKWLVRTPLYHAWIVVHFFVAGLGIVVALVALNAR